MLLSGSSMSPRPNLKFLLDTALRPDWLSRPLNYWQRAGNRAAKRSADKEAVAHFRNAIELLETLLKRAEHAEQELQLLIALGPALIDESSAAPEIGRVYAGLANWRAIRAKDLSVQSGGLV